MFVILKLLFLFSPSDKLSCACVVCVCVHARTYVRGCFDVVSLSPSLSSQMAAGYSLDDLGISQESIGHAPPPGSFSLEARISLTKPPLGPISTYVCQSPN